MKATELFADKMCIPSHHVGFGKIS